MNILEVVIAAAFVLFAAAGFYRGFIKKFASMAALVLSIVLVAVFLPYISAFLRDHTPVYDTIVKQCSQAVREQTSAVLAGSAGGTGEETGLDLDREQIKEIMEEYGYDSALVDGLSDEQLESYVQQYAGSYLAQSGQEQDAAQPGRLEQMEMIENLPLPQLLKDLLLDHNNEEGYENLQVNNFQDYIVHFISTIILNLISFLAAVILVRLLLWGAIAALDLLSHIPVLSFLNRLAGLLLGLVQGLFWLWVFFLLLSVCSATEIGMQLMSMVQQSALLGGLYEKNLFLQIVLQAATLFL